MYIKLLIDQQQSTDKYIDRVPIVVLEKLAIGSKLKILMFKINI